MSYSWFVRMRRIEKNEIACISQHAGKALRVDVFTTHTLARTLLRT